MYWITLYDRDGIEKFTHRFFTKSEQMLEYYSLRSAGCRACDIEKGKYLY